MAEGETLNLTEIHRGGGYDSAFEYESDSESKKDRSKKAPDDPSAKGPPKLKVPPSKDVFTEECSREEGRRQRFHLLALDAYSRHKKLINEYLLCYPGTTAKLKRNTSRDKTDLDVIRENHKFLWEDGEEPDTWEKRLAKKYYDKLFKEYCLTDLSRFKENKIALRWRTEQEVIDGKGQFVCGEKRCNESEGLRSWEVNFGYVEQGQKKNALVKVRLCPDCSYKLNYHYQRKEFTRSTNTAKRKAGGSTRHEASHKRHKSSDEEEQEGNDQQSKKAKGDSEGTSGATTESEGTEDVWKGPAKVPSDDQQQQEDDFEEYLADMLL